MRSRKLFAVLGVTLVAAPAFGQEDTAASPDPVQAPVLQRPSASKQTVDYPAAFFDKYRPVTALDMVERVPGFQIRRGGGSRGFAGASGNILIDGERPTTKEDTVAQILERIPAERVARIELIRGQTGDYDLRGQSVVANVVRRQDAPLSVKWAFELEQDIDSGDPEPGGSVAVSDRWGATEYNASLEGERFFFKNPATEFLFRDGAIVEDRDEFSRTEGHNITGNLNTTTRLSETLINFNGEVAYSTENELEPSRRVPRDPTRPARTVIETDGEDEFELEVGADVATPISPNFAAKAVALFAYEDEDSVSAERLLDAQERETQVQISDVETSESESIARLEFDWTGLDNHTFELNLEGAFNTLDNALELTVDRGDGPMPVPVPGSNTRVEELRGDFALSDSWSFGDFTLDAEIAGETSTISQSGDVSNERSFNFVKPDLSLTYAPGRTQQTRLIFRRDVSQLDFGDFVSATDFGDDDLDLGNPDLAPQNTWVSELSQEWRFGEIGALEVTGFFNWINDVEDLLPVETADGLFEVPGNIGDGERYGIELEATLPLDPLGLPNARLDIDGRWQDSEVTDPVTELDRELTGERDFSVDIAFREDFQRARVAWGWAFELRGDRQFFGVDELDRRDRGVDLEAFVETTRWFGVKMRATLQNILDRDFIRDRRVFEGRRGIAPQGFREFRDRRRGRSLIFEITGTF